MAQTVGENARHLRVALVFGGTIEAEEVVQRPAPIILGSQTDALLPLPASNLLTPVAPPSRRVLPRESLQHPLSVYDALLGATA